MNVVSTAPDQTPTCKKCGELTARLDDQAEAFEDERFDLEEEIDALRRDLRLCLDAVLNDDTSALCEIAREHGHNFDLVVGVTRIRADGVAS